jgi:hypothetical protein
MLELSMSRPGREIRPSQAGRLAPKNAFAHQLLASCVP